VKCSLGSKLRGSSSRPTVRAKHGSERGGTQLLTLLLCGSFLLTLTGCFGNRGLCSLFYKKEAQFSGHTTTDMLEVHARTCTFGELQRSFSNPEDLFHYYYLLHVRVHNKSYVRQTLQADKCSFFVPPDDVLRKYTQSDAGGYGGVISFFTTMLFLPVYAINLLKETVENPYFIAAASPERYIVITPHFGFLTALYAAISLGPFLIGAATGASKSARYFKEAKSLILTQKKELSVAPYKTMDTLLLTPRAGFRSPVELVFYNHKTHKHEGVQIEVAVPK
jgi:hypothetical protein